MTVFASKDVFADLGVKDIKPSHAQASQDCPICLDPLAVHPSHTTSQSSKHHAAIRITACGHVVGKECLDAWLDVGYSCPYPECNRLLFEARSDPITQQDVTNILRMLGPYFDEDQLVSILARLVARQEQEHARLRRLHEAEIGRTRAQEVQTRFEEFQLTDEDFVDSDGELEFSEDEEVEFVVDGENTSESAE